jgi:hypothetical protein
MVGRYSCRIPVRLIRVFDPIPDCQHKKRGFTYFLLSWAYWSTCNICSDHQSSRQGHGDGVRSSGELASSRIANWNEGDARWKMEDGRRGDVHLPISSSPLIMIPLDFLHLSPQPPLERILVNFHPPNLRFESGIRE